MTSLDWIHLRIANAIHDYLCDGVPEDRHYEPRRNPSGLVDLSATASVGGELRVSHMAAWVMVELVTKGILKPEEHQGHPSFRSGGLMHHPDAPRLPIHDPEVASEAARILKADAWDECLDEAARHAWIDWERGPIRNPYRDRHDGS